MVLFGVLQKLETYTTENPVFRWKHLHTLKTFIFFTSVYQNKSCIYFIFSYSTSLMSRIKSKTILTFSYLQWLKIPNLVDVGSNRHLHYGRGSSSTLYGQSDNNHLKSNFPWKHITQPRPFGRCHFPTHLAWFQCKTFDQSVSIEIKMIPKRLILIIQIEGIYQLIIKLLLRFGFGRDVCVGKYANIQYHQSKGKK